MVLRFSHAQGVDFWTTLAVLIFSLVFFGVGITRVVEFKGIGLSSTKRSIFTIAHIIGCLLFSLALMLLAIDVTKLRLDIMGVLVGVSLALLFPVHIYLGLLRRIHLRNNPK
jgi:hypothetical protein